MVGSRAAREAAEEAAWATAETWTRMLDQLTRAVTMTARLPRTLEAMRHGRVSEYKARIIEAQTEELSADDAAKADVLLAAAGQVKNPAGLRDFARRQVARLDPEAAERRRARARQYAHVRLFQEDSGNAGLSAREMPAAEAVIAWANIERRALDLHAAGVEGTAGQLQVQAALDFLLGRATPGQGAHPGTHSHDSEGARQDTRPDTDADADAQDSAHRAAREGTHPGEHESACKDTHGRRAAGGAAGRSTRCCWCRGTPAWACRPARLSCLGSGCSARTTRWTCSPPPGTTLPAGGA